MRIYITLGIMLLVSVFIEATAQSSEQEIIFTGFVFNEKQQPLPYTHVVAFGSRKGDMSDKYGFFSLKIHHHDSLGFYNIAYHDTLIEDLARDTSFMVQMNPRRYRLPETKVFEWGATYEDMLAEVKRLGAPESRGEQIGLPLQTPDAIPFEFDNAKINSTGFLLNSPISYLYYNKSKFEIAKRKVYHLKKNEDRIQRYDRLLSYEHLSQMTNLEENDLLDFISYLNSEMKCDYTCPELEIIEEIYKIWNYYQELNIEE